MTPGLELETEPVSVPNEGQSTIQDQPAGDPTYFNELYGPRLEKLPMQLVNAIKGVVQEFQQQEKYPRRREVMRDRRNRFYERGVQHLYESTQGLTPMVPGQIYSGANGRGQAPTYIDDYNIFLPYERIILSVLTQNAPGIAFRPSNPNYEPDCEAADVAENYAKLYDRANDVKGLQVEQIRMMALSGRTISWTRTEADAQMFGYNEDGSPKRQEVTSFYGTLESKVPVMAKSQKDCLYCILYDDPDVKQARAEYPGEGADGVPFAKKIQAGGVGLGENEYERIARLGILQGTRSQAQQGDAFTHVTTRMRCFLRPASFSGEKFDEPFTEADESMADENGEPPSVKDILAQIYPEGALVTFVGDDYVGSGNGSMDDAIDIAFPYKGDGMSRQAIMDLFVVIQDTFNDVTNGLRQASDVGWPSTWVDGEDQDYDAIAGQKADPYAIRVRKARKDLAMAASFFREPDLVLPDSLMRWIEQISGPLAQLMLATPPVLFGAGDSDAKLMDVNAPIPTPSGFVRNGDLKTGDVIFGEDGNPHSIKKAHAEEITDAYRVEFDDGTSVLVHGGHLWKTFTYRDRKKLYTVSDHGRQQANATRKHRGKGLKPWLSKRNSERGAAYTPPPVDGSVKTTEEIAATILVGGSGNKKHLLNHSIYLTEPVEMPHADLPIDPYVLGAWLGDGNSNGGSHYTATDADGPEILKHFAAAGYAFHRLKSANDWGVVALTADLQKHGLRKNKHIPNIYLWASKEQRLSLLQGLMDTDGTCSKNGRCKFANSNPNLSDGVYHLASSLGLKPFKGVRDIFFDGVECAPSYWVEWCGTAPVFRMPRKLKLLRRTSARHQWRYIVSVTPAGKAAMRCLTTDNPSGLYLFGDNFNVTHNTASGTAQLRSQAMGQLGLIWGMIQRQWARIRYQAALLAGKNPDYAEEVVVATGDETAPIQMSKLMKGKFGAYPDQDSSFPETTAQKRQNLNALIQLAAQSPEFGAQLMSSPDNWKTISELQGFSEIVILEAESRDKQLLEIEQLLQQQPIPPSPEEIEAAQMAEATEAVKNAAIEAQTGVAPPAPKPFDPVSLMKSSVTVEELDFHAWEFAKCQQWLSSDACRRQLAIRSEQYPAGNTMGVMNVRLHAIEHRAYMQAAQAAQAPPEEAAPAKRTMQDQPKEGQPPPAPNAAPAAPAPIA